MEKSNKKTIIVNILIAVAAVGVVAALGSIFTNRNSDWYNTLNHPSEWMPRVVFPIVWSLIYVVFAGIIFILLQKNEMDKELIVLLSANGILNILWCLVFFTLKSTLGGVIVLATCLWAAIMLSLKLLKVDQKLGYFSVIYPYWLTLALFLNVASWILN